MNIENNNLSQLLEKTKNLVNKLKEMEGNYDFRTVFVLSSKAGFDYGGPNWTWEVKELEDLIKEIELSK